ncbi:MAG: hypothetical protein ACLSVD_08075 [Eggerthellaceae bacterium]
MHEGDGEELPSWDVSFEVSKGTYIRSLARDAGVALGCPAHVAALERTELGLLTLEECVSLETLADLKDRAALDPVRSGRAVPYAQGDLAKKVANGSSFRLRSFRCSSAGGRRPHRDVRLHRGRAKAASRRATASSWPC